MAIIAPDREETARRLLLSSARASFDPLVAVDWNTPLDPDRPGLPWHRSSLYGTALWDSMSEADRATLTRHEAASIASVGIWFELILISMLTRHVYGLDAKSQHVQYALTEIAVECRHSVMFAKMCDKLDSPAYGPGRKTVALGRLFRSSRPIGVFASALFVEELLDSLQREAVRDELVQPFVRDVMQIHVVEEARHMRYAFEELKRQLATASRLSRWIGSVRLSLACTTAAAHLIHPRCYGAAGLDIGEAKAAADANPRWRASRAWAARKVMADFKDLGLLDAAPARFIYRHAGLLPAA